MAETTNTQAPASPPAGGTTDGTAPAGDSKTLLGGQSGADAKPGETKSEPKPDEGDKTKAGAPETYADFKLADGVALDKALADQFTPIAKELHLSQEQAQKLVDFYGKTISDSAGKVAEQWEATAKGWAESAKTDKEFGGDAFDANLATAKRAIDRFGTPELVKMFDDFAVGSHPELIRFVYRVGKAIGEDGGGNLRGGGATTNPADRLFPSTANVKE